MILIMRCFPFPAGSILISQLIRPASRNAFTCLCTVLVVQPKRLAMSSLLASHSLPLLTTSLYNSSCTCSPYYFCYFPYNSHYIHATSVGVFLFLFLSYTNQQKHIEEDFKNSASSPFLAVFTRYEYTYTLVKYFSFKLLCFLPSNI